MRILFDQGTPVPLRKFLNPHQVETAFERGWSTLSNGELLAVAEQEGFEVFVTTDRNLRDQQNLSRGEIAIVVLSSPSWWIAHAGVTLCILSGTCSSCFCA